MWGGIEFFFGGGVFLEIIIKTYNLLLLKVCFRIITMYWQITPDTVVFVILVQFIIVLELNMNIVIDTSILRQNRGFNNSDILLIQKLSKLDFIQLHFP